MKNIYFAQAQGSRKEQQDFFGEYVSDDPLFLNHGGKLSIVADGMGGLEKGADASKIAVHSFINAYKTKKINEKISDALKRSAISANKAVYKFSTDEGLSGKTGSTLVALVQCSNEVYWLSVGDSRIYQISNNKLTQLSKDHNYENDLMKLVDRGELTIEDVKNNSQKAALTSYIGSESIAKIDQNIEPVIPLHKDVFMLASDGLYARLTDEEMISIISTNHINEAAKKLVKRKLEKKLKNQDNLTVSLIFQIEPAQKSKTKKMIIIWMMLFLLPFIGASILFGDPFFYNSIKSKIYDTDSLEMPLNQTEESDEDLSAQKEVSSEQDSSVNKVSEVLLAPNPSLEAKESQNDAIINQNMEESDLSDDNQITNQESIGSDNDSSVNSKNDNLKKSIEQENQNNISGIKNSTSTPINEEETLDSDENSIDDEQITQKESLNNEKEQLKISNLTPQQNEPNDKVQEITNKQESQKVFEEVVRECKEINTSMGQISQCKNISISVNQPQEVTKSSSPEKKSCRKADEKLGSQNRLLPPCDNEL